MCLNDFIPHTVFGTDKAAKVTKAVLVSFEFLLSSSIPKI